MSVRTLWAVNVRSTCAPFIGKLSWNHIAKRIPENVACSSERSDSDASLTTGRPAQACRLFWIAYLLPFCTFTILPFCTILPIFYHSFIEESQKASEIVQTKFRCISLTMP